MAEQWCGVGGSVNSTDGTCLVDTTYGADDTAPLVIDIGLKILVAIGTLATVLGLVLVVRWFTKKKRM